VRAKNATPPARVVMARPILCDSGAQTPRVADGALLGGRAEW